MKVWLNGALVEEQDACISPTDRGFLLGDGVFETLRTYEGRPLALREHLRRLAAGAKALAIPLPARGTLEEGVATLVRESGLADARLRITMTSGAGPPGLARGGGSPTVLITATPLEPWPHVATAVVSPWPHDEKSPLAGIKTTSRAGSVLALRHVRAKGVDEALFLNRAGNLCEATTANVFVVRSGRVETPPLSAGCLAGITRERVLRLCGDLAVDAGEADLPADALHQADELFLTSSTREVQPLVSVDGRPVGNGRPGELTQRLAEAFSEMIAREIGSAPTR